MMLDTSICQKCQYYIVVLQHLSVGRFRGIPGTAPFRWKFLMFLKHHVKSVKKSTGKYVTSELPSWDGNFFGNSISTFAWAVHLGKVLLWKIAWDTSSATAAYDLGHHL